MIERPSSALKELIENSIDAGASEISINLSEGGKTLIEVIDNGRGMSLDDLNMCLERHATSKISDGDLMQITSLGFRGEALPSIGSIANLCIESYDKYKNEAWKISIINNKKNVEPSIIRFGTKVTITDLFLKIPARLKFMKTNGTEIRYCKEIVKHLAMSHPKITFTLRIDSKKIYELFREHFDSPKKALSTLKQLENHGLLLSSKTALEGSGDVRLFKPYVYPA